MVFEKVSCVRTIIGFLILSLLALPQPLDASAADLNKLLKFVDPVVRPGIKSEKPRTEIVVRKAWTASEKKYLLAAFERVNRIAPSLIQRATYFDKIRIYRSAFAKGEGPLAQANSFSNYMIFTDRFFDEGAGILTVVHELAHLADLASLNESSFEWDRLVRPRCKRIQNKVAAGRHPLSYRSYRSNWRYFEKTYGQFARKQGMPSVYSCVNWAETLAENVEAMFTRYKYPKDIGSYIRKNFFAVPFKPSPAVAAFKEARRLDRTGRSARAITAYNKVLASYPELTIVYQRRGLVRQKMRDLDGALSDFDKAAKIFQRSERKRAAAWIHSERAGIYKRKRDYKSAVAAYGQALKLNPGWIEYHFERGKLRLEKTKAPREAIKDFDQILRLRNDSVPVYLARAKAWNQLKEFARMEADFATAVKLRPDYPQTYYQRAFANKDRGLCKRAIADFSQIIKLKTNHLIDTAYMERAKCKETIKDYRGAAADYNALAQSVKRWTPLPVPQINEARGLAYLRAGMRNEALKDLRFLFKYSPGMMVPHFTEWVELYPKDRIGYFYRGQAHIKGRKKDPDQAIADFTKAIAIEPQYGPAYFWRGRAYALKKNYRRSLADFDRVIEINPKVWSAYADRSWVHERQGNKVAAIRDLEEAIRLNPSKKLAHRLKALRKEAK